MNNRIKNVKSRKKNEIRKWLKTQLLQESVQFRVIFFVFALQLNFGDDVETCTNSLLLFPLSVQVPCVSGWFWQTMFWLESKNLVFQNQPETKGTCINSGKKNREFVKENLRILKIITNGWLKEKQQKRSQMGDLFLQYMCSHSLSVLLFFHSTVHFSILVVFFKFFWLDCAETQTIWNSRWKKWTIGLKNWTVESKMRKECDWVHNFWKEQSLFVCFLNFFPSISFFWWFGDFYKFFTPFCSVNWCSLCLRSILANHVLSWKQKTGLPK